MVMGPANNNVIILVCIILYSYLEQCESLKYFEQNLHPGRKPSSCCSALEDAAETRDPRDLDDSAILSIVNNRMISL